MPAGWIAAAYKKWSWARTRWSMSPRLCRKRFHYSTEIGPVKLLMHLYVWILKSRFLDIRTFNKINLRFFNFSFEYVLIFSSQHTDYFWIYMNYINFVNWEIFSIDFYPPSHPYMSWDKYIFLLMFHWLHIQNKSHRVFFHIHLKRST